MTKMRGLMAAGGGGQQCFKLITITTGGIHKIQVCFEPSHGCSPTFDTSAPLPLPPSLRLGQQTRDHL